MTNRQKPTLTEEEIIVISYIGRFNDGYGGFKKGEYVAEAKLSELESTFKEQQFLRINTSEWSKKPVATIHKIINAFCKSKSIIIHCSGHSFQRMKGVFILNKLIWRRKIHYIPYGNGFETFIRGNVSRACLKYADYIYVETDTIKNGLSELGINNVVVLYNFRHYRVLGEEEINNYSPSNPLRACIYSRITERKGINEAIKAIKNINGNGYNVSLDIFGPVDQHYSSLFNESINVAYINYIGVVSPNNSVETLSSYDFMIFPTKFYLEGFPGTVLDAYSAGLPIISSNFMNAHDLIIHGETGYIYDFNDEKKLEETIRLLINNKDIIKQLKINCVKRMEIYNPQRAILPLAQRIKEDLQ